MVYIIIYIGSGMGQAMRKHPGAGGSCVEFVGADAHIGPPGWPIGRCGNGKGRGGFWDGGNHPAAVSAGGWAGRCGHRPLHSVFLFPQQVSPCSCRTKRVGCFRMACTPEGTEPLYKVSLMRCKPCRQRRHRQSHQPGCRRRGR